MEKRYQSPPNWPAPPPGWVPPPGWQPDPAWGPAPAGHQFWVDVPSKEAHRNDRAQGVSWLALSALILAIISVLLCWVPIVNNVVFILGLLALGLGVAAVIGAFRHRRSTRGMSITAVCLSVLSLVGVLATQAFYGSLFDTTSPRSEAAVTAPAEDPSSEAGVAPEPAPGNAEVSSDAAALGTKQEVSDYDVTVTGVNLDATDIIAEENQFNDVADGRYVLVDVTVQYLGTDEADPWVDLDITFVGSDARQYDANSCDAVSPNSAMDVPTLENTGTASYQVCMDVPPTAVDGGKLFVERSLTMNDDRAYWALQ